MNKKILIFTSLIFVLIPSMTTAEISVSGETGFSSELTGDQNILPYLGLSLALDSYKFLDQNWSIFWDGLGRVSYDCTSDLFTYGAEAGGDISYMTDLNLSRIGFRTYYEGNELSPDEFLLIEPGFYFSHELNNSTVYTNHTLSIHLFPENSLTYTGSLGLPLLVKSALLIEPAITGGVLFDGEDETLFIDPSFRATWYPGLTYYMDGNIGLKMYLSETTIYEVYCDTSLSYSISRNFQMQIMVPLIFQLREEPDDDWIFFDPQLILNWQLSRSFILSFVLTDQGEKNISLNSHEHKILGSIEFTYVY